MKRSHSPTDGSDGAGGHNPHTDEARAASFSINQLYRHLWTYSASQHRQLAFALFLLSTAELLQLLVPVQVSAAIDILQKHHSGSLGDAGAYVTLIFGTLVFGWLLHGPGRMLERNVAIVVRKAYSWRLTGRALEAPLAWHNDRHSTDVAMRIAQSGRGLSEFAENQYYHLRNLIMIVGPVVGLMILSPLIGCLAMLGYIAQASITIAFDRAIFAHVTHQNQAERSFVSALSDVMTSVTSVYAARREAGARQLVNDRLDGVFKPLRRQITLNELKWGTLDIVSNLLWCGLVVLFVIDRSSVGPLMLGPVYIVYEYVHRANGVVIQFASQFADLARQNADFQARLPIEGAPTGHTTTALAATDWQLLDISGLSHRYGSADCLGTPSNVLSYSFVRGKVYGLIGPSGCGKSTLFRILAGLDEPAAGCITFDGRIMTAQMLRAEATLIPQRVHLLEGTVADNLTVGESVDVQVINQALAHVAPGASSEFLKEGSATRVVENGNRWSGGQRQRVALARGLISAAGSSLILLDEPTNSLDPVSERKMLSDLIAQFPSSCIIAALHSHHLLDLVDEVIIIEDGQLVLANLDHRKRT